MATWSIVVAETSTNLFKNPVAGNGLTNWANTNGTLALNPTAADVLFGEQTFGYSGAALAANSGMYGDLDITAPATTGYVSFWLKGTAPEKLGVYDGAWVYSATPTVIETGPGGYVRYGASFSAADMSGVTKAGCFWSGTVAVYISGAQCEQSSAHTTQIVGDLGPGYMWTGTEHASSSVRYTLDPDGQAVWGGSVVAVDDGANVRCEGTVGVGLLPLEVEKLALAGEVRNLFVGHALQPRDIQLALGFDTTSLATTHTRRAALMAYLRTGREVWLRYHLANATLQIKVAFAGSFDLEGGYAWWGQKTTLQFTALDPRFSLTGPERTSLTLSSSPSSSYAHKRTEKDGWGAFDSGLFAAPRCSWQAPDGTIYVGTQPSGGTAKVQKWTGSAWTDVCSVTGSITAGPLVTALVYMSNGVDVDALYVLGDYTAINGSASTGLAAVNLGSGTATAFGTIAVGGIPRCGLYDPIYRRMWVGGDFTTFAGIASPNVLYYDSALGWTAVTGPTAAVHCMVADAQGNVTMGGDFTNTFPLANMSATTAALATGGALQTAWTWKYRVVARDSAGGLTTGVDSATLTGTSTQGSATISWSAVTGATGYRLYVYTATDATCRRFVGTAGSYWTAIVDLPAGTLSYYDDGTAYLSALREAEHTPPTGNTTGDYGARIVKYVSATSSWERMAQKAGGFNGIVRSLALAGHGGTLMAGGSFTMADGQTANRVAYTRGKRWLPLGVSGMSSGQVNKVVYDHGRVWAVGSFASADGDTLAALVARLDGFPTGGWRHTDVALTNSSNTAYDLIATPYKVLVFDDTTYSSAAGGTSLAYTGTANLYPRFRVTGPGVLRWIQNGLTRSRLVLNDTLVAGEKVVIDCDKRRMTSTLRGDITYKLHASSHLDDWYLAAGQTQTVWCHMTGTTGASSVVIEGYRALLTGDV